MARDFARIAKVTHQQRRLHLGCAEAAAAISNGGAAFAQRLHQCGRHRQANGHQVGAYGVAGQTQRAAHLRTATDQRLKRIKYVLLAVIIGSVFFAPGFAGWAVEIEPFKTAISLYFMRDWPYVLWASACITLSVFVYRGYCRYICPLGAALASVSVLRAWAWLPRRAECGTPCQTCRHRCDYQAIRPDGAIVYHECFQCMDCVVIYESDSLCVPRILEQRQAQDARVIPITEVRS